ncbi:cell growth-regulating nucleolar protein [Macrosteles quadrilineatus]|uniref:cell growth-regulating nucleolar protein n=1 Tax=Macrosteles quadrilineatus TaxID=74068 RepID=UPI0023E2544A|nr:cell growth-regulating nucleolar protein [Macrosteles quadrilineatus]XP_054261870.1 cell growth-regulating nucleolar protein [Macrosteles quadrilineatus]
MVVFTCQHCGDPVKKPAVEKHYNTKCRNKRAHLTCVDCLKDFGPEDYGGHNQCMTEAQRYSAKGTVFKEQKGKKKQEKYIEMIQQIINSHDLNLSQVQKKLLEVCSKYDNVPRKPKPFENFLRNVARKIIFNPDDIQRVFNVIEEACKKETESTTRQDKAQKPQVKDIVSLKEAAKSNGVTDDKIDENIKDSKSNKKNKSSNKSVISNNELPATENPSDESIDIIDQTKFKPKRIKNKMLTDESTQMDAQNLENEGSLNESSTVVNEVKHSIESKKSKKEKRKCKSLSLDQEGVETPGINENKPVSDLKNGTHDDSKENVVEISRKQIKKQKKYEKYLEELEKTGDNALNENQVNVEANDCKKKPKKNKTLDTNECDERHSTTKAHSKENKKRKLEECYTEVPEKRTKEHSEDEIEKPIDTIFNWGDVIMKVLSSRPDKELSLKKLGKKVLNEYQTVRQDHRTYEDLLAKFNKKVNKVKGVKVLRDRAKLIE